MPKLHPLDTWYFKVVFSSNMEKGNRVKELFVTLISYWKLFLVFESKYSPSFVIMVRKISFTNFSLFIWGIIFYKCCEYVNLCTECVKSNVRILNAVAIFKYIHLSNLIFYDEKSLKKFLFIFYVIYCDDVGTLL